jgi:hypothetical protein
MGCLVKLPDSRPYYLLSVLLSRSSPLRTLLLPFEVLSLWDGSFGPLSVRTVLFPSTSPFALLTASSFNFFYRYLPWILCRGFLSCPFRVRKLSPLLTLVSLPSTTTERHRCGCRSHRLASSARICFHPCLPSRHRNLLLPRVSSMASEKGSTRRGVQVPPKASTPRPAGCS